MDSAVKRSFDAHGGPPGFDQPFASPGSQKPEAESTIKPITHSAASGRSNRGSDQDTHTFAGQSFTRGLQCDPEVDSFSIV